MGTIWVYSISVICTKEASPSILQALDIAFPCDDGQPRDVNSPQKYGCSLSIDGLDPVTHYGAQFVVTEEILNAIAQVGLPAAQGVVFWRTGNPDGILQATSSPNDMDKVGQIWTWTDCINSAGLKSYSPPLDKIVDVETTTTTPEPIVETTTTPEPTTTTPEPIVEPTTTTPEPIVETTTTTPEPIVETTTTLPPE